MTNIPFMTRVLITKLILTSVLMTNVLMTKVPYDKCYLPYHEYKIHTLHKKL